MEFVDTHCHIHFPDYELDPGTVIAAAAADGVTRLICVGCTTTDSELGIAMAGAHDRIWATVGVHPHEAKTVNDTMIQKIAELAEQPKVVAIGECGLDYFYEHSPKEVQIPLLRAQIEIALEQKLPMVFHVRDAFADFWPIFDSYQGIRGVVHSFTATKRELDEALQRGLYVGINGIATFTKKEDQIAALKALPLERMVLETDAPYLTPTPYRGTINEPKRVRTVAEFLSDLRGESLKEIARVTTQNAQQLFGIE